MSCYKAAIVELRAGDLGPERLAAVAEALGDVESRSGLPADAQQSFELALSALPDSAPVQRSELLQKVGKTWQNRLEVDAALQNLDLALGALRDGASPTPRDLEAEIQIDRAWAFYWGNELDRCLQALESIGTPNQLASDKIRARYYEALTVAGFRRDRYTGSEETVRAARAAFAAAEASGDAYLMMTSRWTLGLSLTFGRQVSEAEGHLRQTAQLAHGWGDARHEMGARGYLTLVHRFKGDLDQTRRECEAMVASSPGGLLGVWTALAHANLTWVSLRQQLVEEAKEHARAAMAFWSKMPMAYPLQWTALLPLLEVQLTEGSSDWTGSVKTMLAQEQRPLPAEVAQPFEDALRAGERNDLEQARRCAWTGLDQARAAGFL